MTEGTLDADTVKSEAIPVDGPNGDELDTLIVQLIASCDRGMLLVTHESEDIVDGFPYTMSE